MKCVDVAEVMRLHAGQVSTEDEEDLLNHLSRCDRCASLHAEIETMTARLAPDAGEFDDSELTDEVMTLVRLGRAPKEETRTPFWKQWQIWLLVPATAVATAALLLVLVPREGEFQARSAVAQDPDRWVSLQAFRSTDGGYQPVHRELRADDTLAFTYQNRPPSELRFLMIFAVDHRGEVHWYYPAHVDDAESPRSIEIVRAEEPIQLPEQVRHRVAAGPMRIFGLFSGASLDVRTVEQKVSRHLAAGGTVVELVRIDIDDTGQHSLLLDVVASP